MCTLFFTKVFISTRLMLSTTFKILIPEIWDFSDILNPALVWSAGRSAEALRTAASYCLTQTLIHVPITFMMCEIMYESLITTIISLTDDASWMTRTYAAKSMSELGNILLHNDNSKIKTWANTACITLVKHLDDPNDNVRQQVLTSLKDVSKNAQFLESVNLKFLVNSVLTHLDDSDENVHKAVLGKEICKLVAD